MSKNKKKSEIPMIYHKGKRTKIIDGEAVKKILKEREEKADRYNLSNNEKS